MKYKFSQPERVGMGCRLNPVEVSSGERGELADLRERLR